VARLRLFAQARDAAGTAELVSDAASLGELLDVARSRFGDRFASVLDTSRVWVNGDEPASGLATPLRSDDEVAVLPPVSGG
jgi:molybdopterin synthase sulfur carrier subunit